MKTPPDFLAVIAARLGWALLHSLWQGALIAAALVVALHFLRRQRAAMRHAVCMVAMLLLAVSAVGAAWLIRPVATAARPHSEMVLRNATVVESAALVSPEKAVAVMPVFTAPVGAARSWRTSLEPLLPWLSSMWMLGVALLTLRHFVGWRQMGLMRRTGTNARPELQRTFLRLVEKFGCSAGVRLLESAEAGVPMLAGLLKPVVLLPLRVISGLDAREIEAILAHELAHLARRDAWSNLAQVAIETLFFYHPAMWWIGRRARQERENAADDLALEVYADRRVYAEALAQLAELRFDSHSALAATGGSLLARIRRIVRPAPVESPASVWSVGLPALLLVLALVTIFHTQADDAKPVENKPDIPKPPTFTDALPAEKPDIGVEWKAGSLTLNLDPQVVEFEGSINYGDPITTASPAFGAEGLEVGATKKFITPNVIKETIFSTRKVTKSASIFDGESVVIGGIVREDIQKVADGRPLPERVRPIGAEMETKVAGQEIPAASLAAEKLVANQTGLNIAADGSILLNNKVISLAQLGEKLKVLRKQFPDHSVVLRYEGQPNYKVMQAVLEVCGKANVWKIAFGPLVEPVGQAPLDKSIAEPNRTEERMTRNRQKAGVRAADDRQTYQAAELEEIESLYQVANKNWRSEEARTSLKKLLEKFDHANRTGCATLYMGQMSEGADRLEYLTRAVEKFGDCYYFDGCQVGGYGRYVLALALWEMGEKDKARALLAELKTTYKDATDHRGRPMSEVAEAAEKELAAKE